MKYLILTTLLLVSSVVYAEDTSFTVVPNDSTTVKFVNTITVKKEDVQKQIDQLTQQIVHMQARLDALKNGIK